MVRWPRIIRVTIVHENCTIQYGDCSIILFSFLLLSLPSFEALTGGQSVFLLKELNAYPNDVFYGTLTR